MFETLTLTTILLLSFFFWQNQRLGLTAAVPKDPNNRVEFYCSECLISLKGLLPKAAVLELNDKTLCFTPTGSQVAHQLSVQEGKLLLSQVGAPPQSISFLGAEGSVSFEKVSDSGLAVTVEAKTAEASHRVGLRLEVVYA
ncbi:hypothetical protein IV102_08925 [bacterium]|nr:hypothetical protein [bacterium]